MEPCIRFHGVASLSLGQITHHHRSDGSPFCWRVLRVTDAAGRSYEIPLFADDAVALTTDGEAAAQFCYETLTAEIARLQEECDQQRTRAEAAEAELRELRAETDRTCDRCLAAPCPKGDPECNSLPRDSHEACEAVRPEVTA